MENQIFLKILKTHKRPSVFPFNLTLYYLLELNFVAALTCVILASESNKPIMKLDIFAWDKDKNNNHITLLHFEVITVGTFILMVSSCT